MAQGLSGVSVPVAMMAFAAGLCVLCDAGAAGAQRPSSAVLRGHVVDSLGQTLGGTELRVLGLDVAVRTDEGGAFRLIVPRGRYLLRARRISYAPRTVEVDASADTLDLVITLDVLPQQLPEVVVSAAEERYAGRLHAFATRMRLSTAPRGTFVTRRDIEARQPRLLSDLLPRADRRCGARRMMVWVDGLQLAPNTDLNMFRVDEVEALEIYRSPSHVPAQYNITAPEGAVPGCVILIWSR